MVPHIFAQAIKSFRSPVQWKQDITEPKCVFTRFNLNSVSVGKCVREILGKSVLALV